MLPQQLQPRATRRPEERKPAGVDFRATKAFLDSAAWLRFRKIVLEDFPTCSMCNDAEATVVHHIIERSVAPWLALDFNNCVGVCLECHARHHSLERWSNKATEE